MMECFPLKVLRLCSHKIVHMMHCGIAPQITIAQHLLPTPLLQQASRSTTCLGVTQETPPIICIRVAKEKVTHRFPNVLAHATSVDNINIPHYQK